MFNLTRQEHQAILFVAAGLLIGSLITLYKQYRSDFAPDLVMEDVAASPATETEAGGDRASTRAMISKRDHDAASISGAQPIHLNTASMARLRTLPGIGPTLAQRIVDYRRQIGEFHTVDQLLQVKGIGPTILARLKPRVTPGSMKEPVSPVDTREE